jgi:hypothetical protein
MKIFLLWKHTGDLQRDPDPHQVAVKLGEIFASLFDGLPPAEIRQTPFTILVYLELPVHRWKPALFQEDEESWVFAAEYPVNARKALATNGIAYSGDNMLTVLCRNLQARPASLLRELAPPYSLIWSDKKNGETYIQNDGLGHSQLFEFQRDGFWVVTNKIFALNALGIPLKADSEQWAVRFALGWFPLENSGFEQVRFLAPGTQLRLGSHGVHRTTYDVLSDWLIPARLSKQECLEMARSSILSLVEDATPLWDKPGAGLSGGWDSRAVVASLRALGTKFSARVRGQPERYDVVIASRLARIAGMNLKIKSSGGLPPSIAEGCKRSISRALLWQAGQLTTHKHVSFLANRKYLNGGSVNIMGAAGEICRGYYANKIMAQDLQSGQYEERLIEEIMNWMPPFMRSNLRELVRSTIIDAYRQADKYGLEGLRRLDFFYLYERTRRWRSGALGSQPGQAFSPFLNPALINATFSYPSDELSANPFHRYIVATNTPNWSAVPYADEMERLDSEAGKPQQATVPGTDPGSSWRLPLGNETYDRLLHWKAVGEPLIREALEEGGFWTGIFDPDLAKKHWATAPDALAIAHMLPFVLEEGA